MPEMTEEQYSIYLNNLLTNRLANINNGNAVESDTREWKDLYAGFVEVTEKEFTNKIPESEFEAKYSKFFNKDNLALTKFSSTSPEFTNWKRDCEEFKQRVDFYRPIEVVDDHDPNIVKQVFPPILRRPDMLKPSKEVGEQLSAVPDENGGYMTVAEVVSMTNAYFDKHSSSDDARRRHDARTLMHQSLSVVQDRATLKQDVVCTDAIVGEFERRRRILAGEAPDSIQIDTGEQSSEEIGITFDE